MKIDVRGWTLLGAAAFVIALGRVAGFFTDDSYIHLVFARNLADGAGFCFNPGEPVYGFTSPLWVLLLAGFHALAPDWTLVSKLLGALLTLLAVGYTWRLARAVGAGPGASVAAAAALAFHAWFLRWSLSGMETSLAACLVALGLSDLPRAGRAAARGLFVLALASLARPECLLLFAWAAAWKLHRDPGQRRATLAGVALGLLALGGWLAWVHAGTGSWVPTTFAVKRAHEPLGLLSVARPTAHFFGVVALTDLVAAVTLAVALLALRRERGWTPAFTLLAAWPCLLAGLYLATRFQMISRYWVPALPALLVVTFAAAERAFAPRTNEWLRAAYFFQQAAVLLLLVYPGMDAFSRGLEDGPAKIGRWLHDNSERSAVVATPDIGAVGFYSRRRVLDLGGLITPAMAPLLATRDISEITRAGLYESVAHADFLVDRDPRAGALLGPHRHLVMVARMANLGLSRPGPRFYSLYRIDALADSARGRP